MVFVCKTIVSHELSSAGSGSSYLYGFFDQAWKEGMTKDEAEVCVLILIAAFLKFKKITISVPKRLLWVLVFGDLIQFSHHCKFATICFRYEQCLII